MTSSSVPLDKSERSVKDKDIPCSAEHRFALPERFEDQGSGNLSTVPFFIKRHHGTRISQDREIAKLRKANLSSALDGI